MMGRLRFAVWLGVAMLLAGSATALAQAFDPNDTFDAGVIDTSKWDPFAMEGYPPIEAIGGRAVLTLPPDSTADWMVYTNLSSKWVLRGPFDIQVDYELLQWPAHNRTEVGLLVELPYELASAERTSGRTEVSGTDEVYLANTRSDSGCTCDNPTPTTDTVGTLRLTRDMDSMLTAYSWSASAGDWLPISTCPVSSGDARVNLTLWGLVPELGATVAFDNLRVNSGEVIVTVPEIEDVQITRGKWIDSWDWPTYHQKVVARVKEPAPGDTACFIVEEPTGGRYVYSLCAGGAWPDYYGAFPTNWDMWVTRQDDNTLICGFWQRSMLDQIPAAPYYLEVANYTTSGVGLTTPVAPEVPEEVPALGVPERDGVIDTFLPSFEWANWASGVENWVQLRAEGATNATDWNADDFGQIWQAYVADQTAAVYNFGGSPQGPDLEPGRSYFWRLYSSRVEDDYARDPKVRFITTQIAQHRFTMNADWPALPELPGRLAYAGSMWGDGDDTIDFDSELIRQYGPTVETRRWLSSDYFARPNWTWDGNRLLYYRKDQGLWIDSLDGSMPYHIPVDAWGQQSWSPDNERIAYGWVSLTPYWEIWLMNSDGGDVRPLKTSDEHNLQEAAWSPDGVWIAYDSCCDASGYNVWLIRYDGADDHPVVPTGLVGYPGWTITWMADAPQWSPDAKKIGVSFSAASADGGATMDGIGTISRNGGDITPVFIAPPGVVCCGAPRVMAWSPDGRSIVFSSAHHMPPDPDWVNRKFEPGVELFVVSADGTGEPVRLTYDYSHTNEANWWAPNTPVEKGVSVVKGDATVTFARVTITGSTRMNVTPDSPGPAPAGYTFVGDLWNGATTAQLRGSITVALKYDASLARKESLMALMQWDNSKAKWLDITAHPIDRTDRIIRGQCRDLSTFAIAVPTK